ncbi:ceramide glucosyltransferase [Myxozyma melibiosi]|uniref:Ceramide glucosyltransferase n=1 Tax=Myxozyma melibiosi TaxID=54550 RepID=A0ABR1F9I7_9ASCO
MAWAAVFVRTAAGVFGVWYGTVWLVCCIGYYQLRKKFSHKPRPFPPPPASAVSRTLPGISILRPLKGIDTEFEACVSSAFEQAYPTFEILLCVDDAEDPAIPVVREIMARYPSVPSRLFVGAEHCGVNPKVNNLVRAYDAAAHDIVWVLDSNVWVTSGAMARAAAAFEANPRTQLVHHLPICVAVPPPAWGARLDELFMSSAHAKFYTAINTVAVASCVMGKSNLFRRSVLNKVDPAGIRSFSRFIAEDQMIGDGIWKQGGRHAMDGDRVVQPIANTSLKEYFFRRTRWLRVRKYIVTAATLVEPMTECFLCGAMGAFAYSVFSSSPLISAPHFFLLHVAAWAALDYWIFCSIHSSTNIELTDSPSSSFSPTPYFARPNAAMAAHSGFPTWLLTWFLRESLALPIWITAMLGTRVEWRNRLFYIKPDSTAVEIRASPQARRKVLGSWFTS